MGQTIGVEEEDTFKKFSTITCDKCVPWFKRFPKEKKEEDTRKSLQSQLPKNLVVVIAGPTAAGKSDTAVHLAKILSAQEKGRVAELVSADSVQLYRYLDIGSNKPTPEEQAECNTHLVDWLEPCDHCDCGRWTREALSVIDGILDRGNIPIVCGGSCMYIDWLVHGEPESREPNSITSRHIRDQLESLRAAGNWTGAVSLVRDMGDSMNEDALSPHDWAGLEQHLEITGMASYRTVPRSTQGRRQYDMRCFFLIPSDRRALYRRIDDRCEKMIHAGLLEEVADLLVSGLIRPEMPGWRAIGYRQTLEYLARPAPVENDRGAFRLFINGFGQVTRQYAKQQMHWFYKDHCLYWLPVEIGGFKASAEEVVGLVRLSAQAFSRLDDSAAREGHASQGSTMKTYRSEPRILNTAHKELFQQLLTRADGCTLRIPDHLRAMTAEASRSFVPASVKGGLPAVHQKVFWVGFHKHLGWGHPLGRIHKQGIKVLVEHGWRVVEADTQEVPFFVWAQKNACDFPWFAEGPRAAFLPLIRPFPQCFTDLLDDKLELAHTMKTVGCMQPQTWRANDFLCLTTTEQVKTNVQDVWFLKHRRRGMKGQSVAVFCEAQALVDHIQEVHHQ